MVNVAPEVKVGDTAMFAKYAGSELEIDGATHLIISERDILGSTIIANIYLHRGLNILMIHSILPKGTYIPYIR